MISTETAVTGRTRPNGFASHSTYAPLRDAPAWSVAMSVPAYSGIDEYRFEGCMVQVSTRMVFLHGVAQFVEPKTFDTLIYLILNQDHVVRKNELLKYVWRDAVVSDSAIAQCIMKVRHAIGDDGRKPWLVKTVHRVGYRFIGKLIWPSTGVHRSKAGHDAGRADAPSIAWLPTLEESDHPRSAWTSLGLLAVAVEALKGKGLEVFSIRELLRVFDVDAPKASYDRQLKLLHDAGGDFAYVSSSLSTRAGQSVFAWTLHFAGRHVAGERVGQAPAELVVLAAQDVADALVDLEGQSSMA